MHSYKYVLRYLNNIVFKYAVHMGQKISIFKGRFRRVTEELILSAVLVSFLEAATLWSFGFLRVNSVNRFLVMTAFLAVIEIILIIIIEELLISAKIMVKSAMIKRKTRSKK
jgi:hypothetical protein